MSGALRVAVAPGHGVVVRDHDVLAVILGTEADAGSRVRATLAGHAGADLMRELALLVLHEDDLPSFGVAIGSLEDVTVFLHGEIDFVALVDGMTVSGSGESGHEWTERSLPGPAAWLGLGSGTGTPPSADFWDLRGGAVPGGGAWLIGSTSPASASAASAPAAPPPDLPPSVVLVDLSDAQPPAVRSPLPPVSGAPGAVHPARSDDDEDVVLVKGIRCPEGHHNNPRASYCVICGRRMGVSRSLVLVDGPRPPLGVLLLDDGATIPVRTDMVLGRAPDQSALVTGGNARPVAIADNSQSVSRVHLHVRLDEWDVVVSDLGSSNGTFAWDETSQSWKRLDPEAPLTLDNRQRLRLGEREVLFSQHHTRD